MASKPNIQTLISLLEDPDPEVRQAVKNAIMQQGEKALPHLEAALKQKFSNDIKQHIAYIAAQVRGSVAAEELAQWLSTDGNNALRGMYCIAKFIFHNISYRKVCTLFCQIYAEIIGQINENHTALDKVQIINETLFRTLRFTNNYMLNYDTTGHFIHLALQKRQVNPLSLLMLYLCLGERLDIPMQLISLPDNFIISCNNGEFYINPSLNGEIFGAHKLKPYPNLPLESSENAQLLCSDAVVMTYHLARALREAYENIGKTDMMAQLDPAIKAISEKMEIDS